MTDQRHSGEPETPQTEGLLVSGGNEFHQGWLAHLLGEPDDEQRSEGWRIGWDTGHDTPSAVTIAETIRRARALGQFAIEREAAAAPGAGLDVETLAVAMNTAQIRSHELRLGHDLRVPAARILAALGATPDPGPESE